MSSAAIVRALAVCVFSCAAVAQERISFDVIDARLADVVSLIERAVDVDLEPAWQTRRLDGLDPDMPVTLRLSEATLEQSLDRLCEQIEAGAHGPTWQRDGAVVEIGPRSRLNRRQQVVVYDVRDMLFVLPNFDEVPELDLQSVLEGHGGSIFQDVATTEWPSSPMTAEGIGDLVRTLVEPEQWRAAGGDGATMRAADGLLIVKAPGYVHRQIGWVHGDVIVPQ